MTTNWDDDFVEAHPQQRVAAIVQVSKLHRKIADSLTEAYACPNCGRTDIEWRTSDREVDYFQCSACGFHGLPEDVDTKELGPTSETRPVTSARWEDAPNREDQRWIDHQERDRGDSYERLEYDGPDDEDDEWWEEFNEEFRLSVGGHLTPDKLEAVERMRKDGYTPIEAADSFNGPAPERENFSANKTAEVLPGSVIVAEGDANLQYRGVAVEPRSAFTDEILSAEEFAEHVSLWAGEETNMSAIESWAELDRVQGLEPRFVDFAMEPNSGTLTGIASRGWVFEVYGPQLVQVWKDGDAYGFYSERGFELGHWTGEPEPPSTPTPTAKRSLVEVETQLAEALRNSVAAKFDVVSAYSDSVYIATRDQLSVDLLREAMEDSGYRTTDVVEDPDDGFGIWAYL